MIAFHIYKMTSENDLWGLEMTYYSGRSVFVYEIWLGILGRLYRNRWWWGGQGVGA